MPARQPSARDRRPDPGVPSGAPSGAGDRLSLGIEDIPGAVLSLDPRLRVLRANPGASAVVGQPAEGIIGRSFEELLSVPARLLFQTHVYPALLADGKVEEVFLTLAAEGGDPVPVLLNAERRDATSGGARRTGGDRDEAYMVLLVRIRARSRWEQDLLAATRALQLERAESQRLAEELARAFHDLETRHEETRRARQFRDAFIGIVSHELRTPITTIYGMSNLLLRRHGKLAPDVVTSRLADIEAEADRLRRLTEDLLVLSRAEGDRLEVAMEPLVLGHLVRAVVKTEHERAPGHRHEVHVEPGLPLALGEGTYVEQALRNFLSNAAKYSPTGSRIRVSVHRGHEGISVSVTDEGPGFGSDSPEQLWELFFRAPSALRKTSGAGIGLYVSRALIRAMGGDVWARQGDEPSDGAEFGFWLPAAASLDEE